MENLIKTAINDIRIKKKRPSMEEIYYAVKRKEEDTAMDDFKSVFDSLLDNNVIGKFEDRDSYFIDERIENNSNRYVDLTTENENSVNRKGRNS